MKKRLIDASAVEAKIEKSFRRLVANQSKADLAAALSYVGDLIIDAPTVDAVEVVHGRWEDIYGGKYDNPRLRCSVCKTKALYINVLNGLGNWIDEQELSNYCPNCGADMRERNSEDEN